LIADPAKSPRHDDSVELLNFQEVGCLRSGGASVEDGLMWWRTESHDPAFSTLSAISTALRATTTKQSKKGADSPP
jgi:hypothetical protein